MAAAAANAGANANAEAVADAGAEAQVNDAEVEMEEEHEQPPPAHPLDQPSVVDALLAVAQPASIVGPGHDVIAALAASGALHDEAVAHHL